MAIFFHGTDTMYDSVEDIKLITLKKSGEADLPGYDTIGYEKLENSDSDPKASEAPPTKPEASSSAEYSVVMKKPKTMEAKSATDKAEGYNTLMYNNSSTLNSQPRQAVVTYASLNQPISADGTKLPPNLELGEVPPPPVPPPISNDDLLAISGDNGAHELKSSDQGAATVAAASIPTEKNISYQNCSPAQQTSISGSELNQGEGQGEEQEEVQGEGEGGEKEGGGAEGGGGGGEVESLYMNV